MTALTDALADMDPGMVDALLTILDGGVPSLPAEDMPSAEDLAEIRATFDTAPKLAILVVRIMTKSRIPEELAAYARRMYDAYTEAGLPENIVAGLVTSAVNAMSTKAGETAGSAL